MLPDGEALTVEHPGLAEQLCRIAGVDDAWALFERVSTAMGADRLRVCPHFGGYHHTTVGATTPPCARCGAPCLLLVQVEAGDDARCLWTCAEHPEQIVHWVVS